MKSYDAIIIGAGPAGLTAAMYLARAGKKTAVFEKLTAGGKLAVTPVIENYPGGVSADGYTLAEAFKEQAIKSGAELIYAEVEAADLKAHTLFAGGESYEASAVIIAAGAKSGKLNIPREDELAGNGVSYCAVCDGAFFKGKDVVLAGVGERAVKDLSYLAGVCRKVYFVSHGAYEEEVADNVEVIERAEVKELIGTPLEKVIVKTPSGRRELASCALFVDVGMIPDTLAFDGQLKTDEKGFIVTDEKMETSVVGVFAVGDVRSKSLRQVVTAAGDGAVAAQSAIRELAKKRRAAKKN